jgi:predicted restriction endonuclease
MEIASNIKDLDGNIFLTMLGNGILIKWESSLEYIQYVPTNITTKTTIITTLEWWREERQFVKYNTKSKVQKLTDGTLEIELEYDKNNNPHIHGDDLCWGIATIHIKKKNAKQGIATWEDFYEPNHNGTVDWKLISNGLFKKHERENATIQQRQQDLFRKILLTYDERCTISGENTVNALEAAHIIPSKDGGAEVAENGLLLRADIHNLYDSGNFSINRFGRVVNVNNVSDKYKKLLKGKKLPDNTFTRVRDALAHSGSKHLHKEK